MTVDSPDATVLLGLLDLIDRCVESQGAQMHGDALTQRRKVPCHAAAVASGGAVHNACGRPPCSECHDTPSPCNPPINTLKASTKRENMSGKRKGEGGRGGDGSRSKRKYVNRPVSKERGVANAPALRTGCSLCKEPRAGASVGSTLLATSRPSVWNSERRRCRHRCCPPPPPPATAACPQPALMPPFPAYLQAPSGSRPGMTVGSRGILVSCVTSKEQQAGREAANLFAEVRRLGRGGWRAAACLPCR